jgi:hypothetical protein
MNHRMFFSTVLASCAMLMSGTAFAQGMTWQGVMEGGPLGGADTSYTYYMPGMIRIANPARHDVVIIRMDKEKMIHMNTEDHTYYEMTFDELQAMMQELNGAVDERMAKMKKEMEGMSEEQRKMMEGMMSHLNLTGQGKLEFKKTGEQKSISGYPCTKSVVTSNDEVAFTMWVTKKVDGFESMAKDMKQVGQRMAAMMPRAGTAMAEAMKNLDGFPMQTEILGMTSTVSHIQKRQTAASEFEVPSGYTMEKPKGLEKMRKRSE